MDEILALENRRIEAMLKGDVQTLEEILADDLIYTHTTARLDDKASFIDAEKTAKSVYMLTELITGGNGQWNRSQPVYSNPNLVRPTSSYSIMLS